LKGAKKNHHYKLPKKIRKKEQNIINKKPGFITSIEYLGEEIPGLL